MAQQPSGSLDMDRRQLLRYLAGTGALLACGAASSLAATVPVGPALRRGINLTHWFEYEQGQAVAANEMLLLRQSGMDHVRIPVDPVVGGWQPETGALPRFLPALRRAVEQALESGLDVVLDLHLEPASKRRIEEQPALENAVVALWSQLARQFADLPVARLAFELFNEPQYYGWQASRWPVLQRRLLQAVREQAAQHLVLLSGNEGGSIKGLQQLPLVADAAIAYVFHYYDPFMFTHQGAEWLDTKYTTAGLYRGVRYPAQFQAVSPARLSRPHPRAAQDIAAYLKEDWGPSRIQSDFETVGKFAKAKGIRVLCNEFGVIRANVDSASRYRWMADVRAALEARGIGWTLWDYTDIFGITVDSTQLNRVGKRTLEPEALRALGLLSVPVVR
jgi:endoglucanase